jgi:hypothetical protein
VASSGASAAGGGSASTTTSASECSTTWCSTLTSAGRWAQLDRKRGRALGLEHGAVRGVAQGVSDFRNAGGGPPRVDSAERRDPVAGVRS